MRSIASISAVIILTLTGCVDEEKLTIKEELRKLTDPPAVFVISNDKGDTVETANGVKLIIPPGAFSYLDGKDVSDNIKIYITEVLKKSEMIVNVLNTVSDSRLLESFGMIHIKATASDRELKIKENMSITGIIPNKRSGADGKLFYGDDSGDILNWKYVGNSDSLVQIDSIWQKADGKTRVLRTTFNYIDGRKEHVSDTIFELSYSGIFDSTEGNPGDTRPPYYTFQFKKLGWINCDRFVNETGAINLEITLKKFNKPIGFLVFEELNSVIPVEFNANGNGTVSQISKKRITHLIVIDKLDGQIVWKKEKIITESDMRLNLDLEKISAPSLISELQKLDR